MRAGTDARISIIIPAFRAESTLGRTLDSLAAQTMPAWEAIVVDDGSDDATADVAERRAAEDPRIRVLRRPHAGVSATRNAALPLATAPWLHFLDSDDSLAPEALDVLLDAAAREPDSDCVHAGWVLITPDGREERQRHVFGQDQLLVRLQSSTPFAMHAAIFRRDLILEIGGFDPTLGAGEDWDLVLRFADAGARFCAAEGFWSYYQMRCGSASLDSRRMLNDLLRIAARGYRDAWWPEANPHTPAQRQSFIRVGIANYCAGLELGQGGDAKLMLDVLGRERMPVPDPAGIADGLYEALDVAATPPQPGMTRSWPWEAIQTFLEELEVRMEAPGLARSAQRILERRFAAMIAPEARPRQFGRTLALAVELEGPQPDVETPPGVDRLHCAVLLRGEPLEPIELAVSDGVMPGPVIADVAVAVNRAAAIEAVLAISTSSPRLRRMAGALRRQLVSLVWRIGRAVLNRVGRQTPVGMAIRERTAGWPDVRAVDMDRFLDEVWGRRRRGPLSAVSHRLGRAAVRAADDRLDVEVSDGPVDVIVEGPTLLAHLDAGGEPVGSFSVPAPGGCVSARTLRAAANSALGLDLCLVALRVALGQKAPRAQPVRRRLARAAAEPAPGTLVRLPAYPPLATGWERLVAGVDGKSSGLAIARRVHGTPGTASARPCALPPQAAEHLVDAARVLGEPVVHFGSGETFDRVVYVPGLDWQSRNGRVAMRAAPGAPARGPGASPSTRSARRTTSVLPILMYHRIEPASNGGSPRRWSVACERFEEQMAYLSEAGYRTVTPGEWRDAARAQRPLDGRRVMLTFDDGTADFARWAAPVLQRHGFGATVFLVSDLVGQRSEWDAHWGEAVELMGWDEVRELERQGFEFGAHGATHTALTALENADIVREASCSRVQLAEGLGHVVTTFAYPFGDQDPATRRLVGGCGFELGFTCREAPAQLKDDLLDLPRIEVPGWFALSDFVRSLPEH
jgi:glycosyltransferase involved in cell wall biosynthesis/peptidoglycan/xylan/chitin deacetylase (PgdA/CDA1 family)